VPTERRNTIKVRSTTKPTVALSSATIILTASAIPSAPSVSVQE